MKLFTPNCEHEVALQRSLFRGQVGRVSLPVTLGSSSPCSQLHWFFMFLRTVFMSVIYRTAANPRVLGEGYLAGAVIFRRGMQPLSTHSLAGVGNENNLACLSSHVLIFWSVDFCHSLNSRAKGHEDPYSSRSTEHVAEWYSVDLEGQMKYSIQNNPFIELEI